MTVFALRRRYREQAGTAAAGDIVEASEPDVIALDFHDDRCGQALAVEFTERHGEIGGMAVPADREVGTERDLCGALRTAYRDLPFASLWRRFLPLDQFLAQAIGCLLQRQTPVIHHEHVVRAPHRPPPLPQMRA